MHDECFLTVYTNSPLWNLFTSRAWCWGGGGCSALMQSAAHCYPTLFKIKMLKCSSCFDLETKPHCKSKHELAWPRSPLLTSGLDSKPSRCGSQFGEATLQMVPAYSIKTFIWKKFLTATERGGEKRREIPWSRPFSNPCGGKAIREQLRDEDLEDDWQVS